MTIIDFPKKDTESDAVQVFDCEVRAYNSTDDQPDRLRVSTVLNDTQSVTGLHTPQQIFTLTYDQTVALRDALDAALAAGYPSGGRVA